jgi:hypothetical protein
VNKSNEPSFDLLRSALAVELPLKRIADAPDPGISINWTPA